VVQLQPHIDGVGLTHHQLGSKDLFSKELESLLKSPIGQALKHYNPIFTFK
jgi:hypothetical protein